jgi:hypothetical protein
MGMTLQLSRHKLEVNHHCAIKDDVLENGAKDSQFTIIPVIKDASQS